MMFDLPKSTEYNRRIPKQTFYEKAKVSAPLKKFFVEKIDAIVWRNKLALETSNLAAGIYVREIEFIELLLRAEPLDEKVLRLIDKAIPYQIIFVLSFDGFSRACATYKHGSTSKHYFYSDWFSEEDAPLSLRGLTLDDAYENFVRRLAGEALQGISGETFSDVIERFDKILLAERKMKSLRRKIRSEKQFNLQLEMNRELKILSDEVERLRRGSVDAEGG